MVDEFPQAQVPGEGGRQEQAGIGHQAMVVKDDADTVGIVLWRHLLGAPCFRAGFCSKTIIPDSEEHPIASSRAVPKAVLRWIRAKETIQAGLSEAQGTMEVRGGVKVSTTLTAVTAEAVGTGNGTTTVFTLTNKPVIPGSQTVNVNAVAQTYGTQYTMNFDTGSVTFTTAPANTLAVTADYTYYSVTDLKITVANAAGGRPVDMTAGETVLTYLDVDTVATNIQNFTLTRLGGADADNLLEAGEMFEITVDSSTYGLTDGDQFIIQIKPPSGAVVLIERTIPAKIEKIMDVG